MLVDNDVDVSVLVDNEVLCLLYLTMMLLSLIFVDNDVVVSDFC